LAAPGDIQPGSRRRGDTPAGESNGVGLGVEGVLKKLVVAGRCFSRGMGVTGMEELSGARIVGTVVVVVVVESTPPSRCESASRLLATGDTKPCIRTSSIVSLRSPVIATATFNQLTSSASCGSRDGRGQEGRSVRVDAERPSEAARSGRSAEEDEEEEEMLVPWASSIEAKKAGLFIGSRECMRL
jgi:hypothetical protein